MKFIKDNKLLISLFLAILLVLITIAVMTTARNIPGMSKYTERAYYDIPKAPSPQPDIAPNANMQEYGKIGFIDPVVRERLREQRQGVPLPTDILPGIDTIPGVNDGKYPDVSQPMIQGYGPMPKDTYDELYKENSPYKLLGRPGRLGALMRKVMTEKDKAKPDSGEAITDTENNPSAVPFGSVHVQAPSESKFKSTLAQIIRTLEAVRKASESKKAKPVEGKLEKSPDKKDNVKDKEEKKSGK